MITDLWRHEAGKYFCISTKTRAGAWHDEFFERSELDEVAGYVREHIDKNVYFCPHGFSSNRPPPRARSARVKENAVLPSLLWADMDKVDPRKCKWKPTIAIQSSPGRYVGLWECDDAVTEDLNKRLTYAIGADHSGHDLTQVLRLPGTINYKYAALPRVKVMWRDGPEYSVRDLSRTLPKLERRKAATGGGDIDWDAVRELDKSWRSIVIKRRAPISSKPMLNDDDEPDRSITWSWQAKVARDNRATDEELAVILLHCRRTVIAHPSCADHAPAAPTGGVARASRMAARALRPLRRPVSTMEQRAA